MAELKTKPTKTSVAKFIAGVADEQRRADCQTVLDLMKAATGAEPEMWGKSIVGFGKYHYKYASGCEGDWFQTGFSPRKQDLTLYIIPGLDPYANLVAKLGKFKAGKSCLYVKRLADIDLKILKQLIDRSVKALAKGAP